MSDERNRGRELEAAMNSDKRIDIYALELFSASVCSSYDIEETVRRVNAMMCGVTSWQRGEDKFADGTPSPHPCERDAARIHVLLE